jgi:hypothetical protein
MRLRWRILFPLIGLMLFASETLHSLRVDRENHGTASRYFWWSSLRLDADPLNKSVPSTQNCRDVANCSAWDLPDTWVSPGAIAWLVMLSGLPAFIACRLFVSSLGRIGISEVRSFMVSMPLLLVAWYYLLGWMVDRFRNKNPEST